MDKYIPYEWGNEWHYLSEKYRLKYGTNWNHRYGFDLTKLTKPELKLYMTVYGRTMKARGYKL